LALSAQRPIFSVFRRSMGRCGRRLVRIRNAATALQKRRLSRLLVDPPSSEQVGVARGAALLAARDTVRRNLALEAVRLSNADLGDAAARDDSVVVNRDVCSAATSVADKNSAKRHRLSSAGANGNSLVPARAREVYHVLAADRRRLLRDRAALEKSSVITRRFTVAEILVGIHLDILAACAVPVADGDRSEDDPPLVSSITLRGGGGGARSSQSLLGAGPVGRTSFKPSSDRARLASPCELRNCDIGGKPAPVTPLVLPIPSADIGSVGGSSGGRRNVKRHRCV